MSLIVALLLSYFFLDGPWRFLVIIPAVIIEGAEIYLWLRWRGRRSITGVEALVGATGVATTPLKPEGQVRVKGHVWSARSDVQIAVGEPVEVLSVDGLHLEVAPTGSKRPASTTSRPPAT